MPSWPPVISLPCAMGCVGTSSRPRPASMTGPAFCQCCTPHRPTGCRLFGICATSAGRPTLTFGNPRLSTVLPASPGRLQRWCAVTGWCSPSIPRSTRCLFGAGPAATWPLSHRWPPARARRSNSSWSGRVWPRWRRSARWIPPPAAVRGLGHALRPRYTSAGRR